jgi:hypothetical protein
MIWQYSRLMHIKLLLGSSFMYPMQHFHIDHFCAVHLTIRHRHNNYNRAKSQLILVAGLWDLKLAPGRSRQMYDMVDIPDLERTLGSGDERQLAKAPARDSLAVLLHSLSGAHLLLPLRKLLEFKGQDVLQVCS